MPTNESHGECESVSPSVCTPAFSQGEKHYKDEDRSGKKVTGGGGHRGFSIKGALMEKREVAREIYSKRGGSK